jgi:hypothetical protein
VFQTVLLVVLAITLLLCFSLLIYQGITGVPTMSSSSAEAEDVVSLLRQTKLGEHPTIVDLGCGWGSLAIALASAFPNADIVGIEISPFPYWVTRLRVMRRSNVRVTRTDFFRYDLRNADAVVCYLMMKPMPKLAAYLDRMLRDRTPVVALTFWFRGRTVSAVSANAGPNGSAALYHWPARAVEIVA